MLNLCEQYISVCLFTLVGQWQWANFSSINSLNGNSIASFVPAKFMFYFWAVHFGLLHIILLGHRTLNVYCGRCTSFVLSFFSFNLFLNSLDISTCRTVVFKWIMYNSDYFFSTHSLRSHFSLFSSRKRDALLLIIA